MTVRVSPEPGWACATLAVATSASAVKADLNMSDLSQNPVWGSLIKHTGKSNRGDGLTHRI
jgi:hypothetical protein